MCVCMYVCMYVHFPTYLPRTLSQPNASCSLQTHTLHPTLPVAQAEWSYRTLTAILRDDTTTGLTGEFTCYGSNISYRSIVDR